MKNPVENAGQRTDYAVLFNFLMLSPTVKLEKGGNQILLTHGEMSMRMTSTQLAALVTKGLVSRKNRKIELTEAGRNLLPPNHAHRNFNISMVDQELVVVNSDESPLATLANRIMPDGTRFLQSSEFDAGERIRSDFTRAMLMPRTSANWQASVSRGARSDRANGVEEITHAAIAARDRLDAALQCLGRDLAGVVADICCYLKGFEQVELERHLPKRSAKFMLKAALSILALHYNPPVKRTNRSHKWGAPGYRPEIN